MFHAANLTVRDTQPLSDAQMAALPSDWLVIFFQRRGSRRIEQEEEMVRMLQATFGHGRVRMVTSMPNVTRSKHWSHDRHSQCMSDGMCRNPSLLFAMQSSTTCMEAYATRT